MSIYRNRPTLFSVRIFSIVGLGCIGAALGVSAAPTTWNGPATASTANVWSSAGNWTTAGGSTPPGVNDDVKFFDAGSISGVSNINNTVDATMTIGSLQFGNTNNNHTTLISSGVTLSVTNTSGVFVGTPGGAGAPNTQQVNTTVTGQGFLVVTNRVANFVVNQGASANGTQRATLDLTGLDNFSGSVRNIFVGSTGAGTIPTANGAAVTGTLLLAKTNNITVVFSPANVHSTSLGIDVGYNGAGTQGGTDFLYLGQMNTFNVDTIAVGRCKGVGVMGFAPTFTNSNPTAVFRGTNGGSTRVTYWTVGDQGPRGSGSGVALGTNDFTAGTLDAMVDTLVLGQDPFNGGSSTYYGGASSGNWGVFAFNAGTLDVNTLALGNIQSTWTNKNPSIGILRINGNATLKVNTVLQMGYTVADTSPGTAAANTYGQLGITNGTAFVNSITVASNTISANNRISLSGSTLIVSNALASNQFPLTNFFTANSLLGFTITSDSATKAFVGTLTTGGSTNVIQLGSAPVFFGVYPAQIALIKYASLNAYNFGLTNVPGWAAGASLSNNVANKSIDLVLPSDPRPIITVQPASYSGNPGDNVTFSVTANGVAPLIYQWRTNGVNITDGPTGNGSTNFGSSTSVLGITNAQPADSVSAPGYTVVITNLYGSVTSSPAVLTISAGAVAPSITGPVNQTVIQGNNATFTASVAGSPLPDIQWQTGGTNIPGANSPTLVVNNVQYPVNDQQIYSIIATNSAGSVTNSATLTVIVPPVITSQPVSLVVTNTQAASFTVAATGVPNPTYQWYKDNVAVPASTNNTATNATFTIASTKPSDIANYYVLISNSAGSTNSVTVALTVNSLMSVTAVSPTNGATGLCYDTPLSVTFSTPPVLRKAGTIKIFNVTNALTPVDTIDLSLNKDNGNGGAGPLNNAFNIQPRFIEGIQYSNFPVIITGNAAAIYPHLGVMTSNQTYYVTIDNGCFTDTSGAYFAGIASTNFWQFTTKPTGPVNPTNLVVAADGTGDFLTVQGAADFIPANNTTYTLINIRNGTYTEIVCVQNKHNITFRGQNRNATRLAYANNNNMNGGFNGQQTCSLFRCNGNDIAIENLTLTNTTPQGGSQAFALQVGNGSQRFIALNSEISSYQDTILVANPPTGAYFRDSLIQGDVDYIWGGATMFFTNCEMRTVRATGGYVTNPRAPLGSNGISFVKCSFTVPGSGYVNSVFARAIGQTNGNTVLVNCRIDTSAYTGWNASDVANIGLNNLRWWEYGNSNLNCTAAATFNGTQIGVTNNDPRLLAAQDSTTWLNGWVPQLAPNILTNPASQTVNYASPATFTVLATGIPDPTYQWQHAGTNLPGATSSALTIASATLADAGSYAVIVTTSSGTVTSAAATLTVNPPPNTPPVFTAPLAGTNIVINVGVNLSLACTATDSDTPAQTLTYALLTGPSGATLDTNSGTLNWRPSVVQANSSNAVSVAVTDNGIPNLSSTNSFSISVNPLTQPSMDTPAYFAGQFTLSVSGQIGPDYTVQVSTNLTSGFWSTLYTTNPAAMPFSFTDTNGALSMQFYRILVGP